MAMLYLVAGARPNFMKIAPIVRALQASGALAFRIIHTGQHYDEQMSAVFFRDLGIPRPDRNLGRGGDGGGSGDSAMQQAARIMVSFEKLCRSERPDAVLVVGDVTSTLACAIAAKTMNIPVAHVEAGLRSGDMTMPEEVNRIATDSISDWFFVTEPSGLVNLRREGKQSAAMHYVGQVMVDNLLYQVDKLGRDGDEAMDALAARHPAARREGRYGVVTLHRPANVDSEETLRRIAGALKTVSAGLPLFFPVHPRTRARLDAFGIDLGPGVHLMEPLGYMDFLRLWKHCSVVLTDSGGLQEETTALGVPCITLRDNTERPITLEEGTNVLAGTHPTRIISEVEKVIHGERPPARRPQFWDGKAAERIVGVLERELARRTRPAPVPASIRSVSKVLNIKPWRSE